MRSLRVLWENILKPSWISFPRIGVFILTFCAFVVEVIVLYTSDISGIYKTIVTILLVVSAIILVVFLFLLPIINFLRDYASLKTKFETPEAFYNCCGKLYGLIVDKRNTEYELKTDGSLSSKHNIELIATTNKIYSIEHFAEAPHAPASEEYKFKKSRAIGGSPVEVDPIIIPSGARHLFAKIHFKPSLPPGKKVAYYLEESAPQEYFAMTLEELKKREMEWEFCSVRISYPTKQIAFEVVFPPGFDPREYDYDVWFGDGQVQHVEEYTRIHNKGFWKDGRKADGRMFVRLNIDYPIHGLTYVVKWKPPK